MIWWQFLLFPFAILYDLVTRIRNGVYDNGIKKAHHYPEYVIISVGNLSVGGTGKTPMVEFLIRYGLKHNWKMATLSRGYGRKTKGVRMATTNDSAQSIGDESYGYYEQFGEHISVVVAEKRVDGIEEIKNKLPDVNVILLDDAFQHRSVKPDLSFLLTTQESPFWKDFLLPSGRLREARKGHKRATLVVITKTIVPIEIPSGLTGSYCSVRYGEVVMMAGEKKSHSLAVAGLSDPTDFFNYSLQNFSTKEKLLYADHYAYQLNDILKIVETCGHEDLMLITTYKDAVKLKEFDELKNISWGYVPIEIEFVSGEEKVSELLHSINKKMLG
ncbi:MAG: tetraacyldisaccharide 4'-kinase [Cytophagales bacterium]|nr:tetraacyldisaccharide 4'-kinase [Cytophagales bacterium]